MDPSIWSEPLFELGVSDKNQKIMANSVDPDEGGGWVRQRCRVSYITWVSY